MNKKSLPFGIISIVIILLCWLFVDAAAAGILTIIAATLIISLEISADAAKHMHPEIFAFLKEDAQTIVVENLGTALATSVSVRIIPDDIRYDIGEIRPDENHQYVLPVLVREAKAAVSWDKRNGEKTEKIFRLTGYADETDPMRPVFPLFNWKEK